MGKLIVWFGELATPGQLYRRGLWWLLPATLWLLTLLILPSFLLIALAFAERGQFGEIIWNFNIENFRRVIGYGVFGFTLDNLFIFVRTIWVAFLTTLFCVVLAFPLAFFIASRPPRTRYLWLALVIVPFWTNLVIRTYGWQMLFSPGTPFTEFAKVLGIVGEGQGLYPSAFAVYVGMITAFLPFLVLPLFSSVERIDWSLVEATQDLYASRVRTFTQGILPQVAPGLTVGVILTFIPAMGMFVIPDLLGGSRSLLMGNLIQQQFLGAARDWPYGAALSIGLVVITLIGLAIYRRQAKEVDIV